MSREERLKDFAARCPSGDVGHVHLIECAVCGWLDWSSTDTKQPKGLSVSEHAGCGRCREAFMRDPEVAGWVLAALGKLREEIEEAKDARSQP